MSISRHAGRMLALFALFVLFAFPASLQPAVADSQVVLRSQPTLGSDIVPGLIVDEELRGGESRSHRIRLKAGSTLEVSIKRFGIDVSIRVIGPKNKLVAELDNPNGAYGPKRLLVIAQAAGIYRVDITAHDVHGSGRYRLRVPSIGRATATDQERSIAQGLFIDASRLAKTGKRITQEVIAEYEKARRGFENAGDQEGEAIVCFALA